MDNFGCYKLDVQAGDQVTITIGERTTSLTAACAGTLLVSMPMEGRNVAIGGAGYGGVPGGSAIARGSNSVAIGGNAGKC